MSRSLKYIYILLFYAFAFGNISAQTGDHGIIRGRIYNEKNNEPVAFATVAVYGTTLGTLSDSSGRFQIKGIKPGYVRLKVTCIGYKGYLSPELLVTNAQPSYLDVSMEEEAVHLHEVVVTGGEMKRNEESPVSLRTLGIKEIEKTPGANRDISKVIQSLPGVMGTLAYRNDIIVRGGGPFENRFYLDDVEIPTLNHFSTQGASGGPVGIINVDFIRQVSFYSSAFPSDRGNALSSVIEIRQIDGNRDRMKIKGSLGATDLALTLDGPLNKKKNATLIFSVRRSYLQFLFAALQLPFLPTYNDMQYKAKIILNDKNILTFIGLGAVDNSQLNLKANKTQQERYILGYLPVSKQWSYTIGAVYKHFGENSYQTWVLSRNYLNNRAYKYENNISVDSLKNYDYSSFEAENRFRFENNQTFANGVRLNYGFRLKSANYYNSTFNRIFNQDSVSTIDYHSTLGNFQYGFFAQATQEFIDNRLSVSAGLRSDANSYTPEMNNPLHQLSPHLALSWMFSNKFFLNANIGEYHEIPPYTTMGFRNNAGTLVNRQNGLRYISADHWVAGIEYLPRANSKFTLEGFYKNYHHYPFSVRDSIAIASEGMTFGTFGDEEVRSISKGKAYGAELYYLNNDLKNTNIMVSYTYVRSKFDNGKGTYYPSSWDTRNLLNIAATRTLNHNWRIGLKWRYVGGSPYTPYDYALSSLKSAWNTRGQGYLDYSKFNADRLRSFHQLDARIDKEYFYPKWTLNFYLDVQNVYDYKAQQPPLLLIDQAHPNLDATHYNLVYVKNEAGTVLPTLGVIVSF